MSAIRPGWRALLLPTAEETAERAHAVVAAVLRNVGATPAEGVLDREVGGWVIGQFEPAGDGARPAVTLCYGRHPSTLRAGDLWRAEAEYYPAQGWTLAGAAVSLGSGWLGRLRPVERLEGDGRVQASPWSIDKAWCLR